MERGAGPNPAGALSDLRLPRQTTCSKLAEINGDQIDLKLAGASGRGHISAFGRTSSNMPQSRAAMSFAFRFTRLVDGQLGDDSRGAHRI